MCKMKFVKKVDEIEKYYDRLILFKRYGYDLIHSRKFTLSKFGINQNVLEIGTGKGHTTIGLVKKRMRVTTVDIDKKSLGIAQKHLKALKLNSSVSFKVMNAECLRFPNNAFDGVISVNFVHHAKHPRKCIREMVRVARKTVVISDLNKRGGDIMDRIHALDGLKHEKSRMSLKEIEEYLKKLCLKVKVYRDKCQTVFVAKKGK